MFLNTESYRLVAKCLISSHALIYRLSSEILRFLFPHGRSLRTAHMHVLNTECIDWSPSASFPPMPLVYRLYRKSCAVCLHLPKWSLAKHEIVAMGRGLRLVSLMLTLYGNHAPLEGRMWPCISITGFAADHYRSRLLAHGLRFLVSQACLAETMRQALTS